MDAQYTRIVHSFEALELKKNERCWFFSEIRVQQQGLEGERSGYD